MLIGYVTVSFSATVENSYLASHSVAWLVSATSTLCLTLVIAQMHIHDYHVCAVTQP